MTIDDEKGGSKFIQYLNYVASLPLAKQRLNSLVIKIPLSQTDPCYRLINQCAGLTELAVERTSFDLSLLEYLPNLISLRLDETHFYDSKVKSVIDDRSLEMAVPSKMKLLMIKNRVARLVVKLPNFTKLEKVFLDSCILSQDDATALIRNNSITTLRITNDHELPTALEGDEPPVFDLDLDLDLDRFLADRRRIELVGQQVILAPSLYSLVKLCGKTSGFSSFLGFSLHDEFFGGCTLDLCEIRCSSVVIKYQQFKYQQLNYQLHVKRSS